MRTTSFREINKINMIEDHLYLIMLLDLDFDLDLVVGTFKGVMLAF